MVFKTGVKNPNWRGDQAKYKAIHMYMRSHLTGSDRCQKCGMITIRLDLANITGVYNRDPNNWKWWCRKCHNLSHKYKDMSNYRCSVCDSNKTYIIKKTGRPNWARVDGKLVCNKCLWRVYKL